MKFTRYLLVLWLFPATVFFHSFGQGYVFFQYSQQNGLPQNSVIDLHFDSNQYLWLTTEAGLVRFDGNRFKTFQSSNNPLITNERFRWILMDPNKQIISSAANGQLWRIHQNTIELLPGQQRIRYNQCARGIPSINTLLSLNNKDPKFLKQQGIRIFPTLILAIDSNAFYALGKHYLYQLNNDLIKTDSFNLDGYKNVQAMFRIGKTIYLQSQLFGIVSFDKAKRTFTPCLLPPNLNKQSLKIYWKQGYDHPLAICNNQLYILSTRTHKQQFEARALLPSLPVSPAQINQILYNRSRNIICIATKTNGFFIYRPTAFKTLSVPGQEGAYGQTALSDSSILNGFGYEITPNGIRKNNNTIRSVDGLLFRDTHGTIWYSSSDTLFINRNGLSHPMVVDREKRFSTIYEHKDTIIATSYKHIYLFVNYKLIATSLLPLVSQEADVFDFPFCFAHTGNQYYFGSTNGIYKLNILKRKTIALKLNSIQNVRYLYPINDTILLGCSYGLGFFALVNHRYVSFPLDRNMHLSKAHSIRIDRHNRVFISTNNGMFYTSLQSIANYLTHQQKKIHYQYLNDKEGLLNVEFNGGCVESSVTLRNGYFSFSNMGGYVFFHPDSIHDNFPRQPIYIDYISVDGKYQSLSDTVTIDAAAEQITIGITSPYWGNQANIDAEYKIESYNKEWIPISTENNDITLINLPSGNHTLLIRRRNGFGPNDYTLHTMTLIKEKRYYETLWFILICLSGISGLLYGANTIYNKRLRIQNALLEQRVSARTQELLESNKSLVKSEQELMQAVNVKNKLISIISHDIVTPIKFISIVSRNFKSDSNDRIPEQEVIREIHHTSQRLHENAQNILNWVRYQNNLIKVSPTNIAPYSIVEDIADLLKEIATSRKNQIINDVEMDDIIKNDKTILTIILQNILSNAVKYTHSSTITISSSYHNNRYVISIKDDGPGISKQNLLRIENIRNKSKNNMFDDSADGTGLGFVIIFELADLIGALVEIESSQESGTTVRITL